MRHTLLFGKKSNVFPLPRTFTLRWPGPIYWMFSSFFFKVWLNELSVEMKETLRHLLNECLSVGRKGAVDPLHYPSQVHTQTLKYLTDLKSSDTGSHSCFKWLNYGKNDLISRLGQMKPKCHLFFTKLWRMCMFYVFYVWCRFSAWLSKSSLLTMWKEL